MTEKRLTVPNMLTGFRFVAAPVLLWLAWHGHPYLFLGLLAVSFSTDVLDGFVARLTGQATAFGARLDSIADAVIYITIAISVWWLWPDIVRREIVWISMVVGSFLLPVIVAAAKFRLLTSYHTMTVKAAAAATGLSLYVLFLDGPAWPFHLAAVVCVIAAVEEIAITALLKAPHSNVQSILSLIGRRGGR